jgi:hypothetical protein
MGGSWRETNSVASTRPSFPSVKARHTRTLRDPEFVASRAIKIPLRRPKILSIRAHIMQSLRQCVAAFSRGRLGHAPAHHAACSGVSWVGMPPGSIMLEFIRAVSAPWCAAAALMGGAVWRWHLAIPRLRPPCRSTEKSVRPRVHCSWAENTQECRGSSCKRHQRHFEARGIPHTPLHALPLQVL